MTQKSYLDYRFLGVHSFINTLDQSGSAYYLFDDDYSSLFKNHCKILKDGEDTLRSGIVTREDQSVFFTEIAMKLTKSYSAYIVFIFNHHPTIGELNEIVLDLEHIVMENAENIDINQIAETLDVKSSSGLSMKDSSSLN